MSVRRAIVEADVSMMNVAEFCRTHRVSTWFFWDLRRRYAREGDLVLTPKSTAPHRVPSRTSPAVEDAIVAKRKELLEAGLDAGPATIRFHLDTLDGLPSESTIWRILVARGQVVAQPSKAPKSRRSFTATRANEVWALDDTDWALADGTGVKILNIIDDHSRLDIASQAMPACHGPNVLATMATAAQQHGWPERFWSDNARVFTHTLANAVQPLGVIASHTRPFSPNSNGKVERFHQTVKRWLNAQPRADTLDDLQHQLDTFRHIYNTRRPHRALDRRFPADVWNTAAKTGPTARPINTPTIVTDTIVSGSRVYSGPYAITIGAQHDNQRALTIITGNRCHIFVNGRLARTLTLDPTRRSQPLRTT
jgi:transposase InsO family protein